MRSLRTCVALSALCLAAACESDPYEDENPLDARVAVGAVEGTDIVLGALIDGDALAVYQCGGDQTFATHTQWFRGRFGTGDDPNAFELQAGDLTLSGFRDADGLEGEMIDADGTRHAFAADAVADDALAGVFVAQQDGASVGVVVRDQGGTLVGQGASCRGTEPCFQVIILPPTITSETLDVQTEIDGTTVELQVSRTLTDPAAG